MIIIDILMIKFNMTIYTTIKVAEEIMQLELTPLKAIRFNCIDCAGSRSAARSCEITTCPLWHNRRGKRSMNAARTPVKAVREYCLECQGGSMVEVRTCSTLLCPLYNYRKGTRPND